MMIRRFSKFDILLISSNFHFESVKFKWTKPAIDFPFNTKIKKRPGSQPCILKSTIVESQYF